MNTRLEDRQLTGDRVVRGMLAVTLAVAVLGALALARATVAGGVDHVTVRIDNQAGLAVQVDAVDAAGDRVGLGEARSGTVTSFQEVPDLGARWTLVASYGGQEVDRQQLARAELAAGGWTVTVPADATSALEEAGLT